VYQIQKIIYTENQKVAQQQLWGHLAFRGCTLKRYSPVAVRRPTKKKKKKLHGKSKIGL